MKDENKHKLRVQGKKTLDPILPYTSYSVGEDEYLGEFNGTRPECISWLKSNGYHYQLLAAVKSLDGNEDVGSYARLPENHPQEARGTALGKEREPKECQYHVHLFNVEGRIKLYGHYEVSPYPHYPSISIQRMYPDHYYPTWDKPSRPKSEWEYLRGVVDNRLEDRL